MKNRSLKLVYGLFMAITLTMLGNYSFPQSIDPAICATVVGKGCVGACGSTSSITYTVVTPSLNNVTLCFGSVKSSLCPNTGAKAVIYKNKVLIGTVDITKPGSGLSIIAKSGDVIYIEVSTYPIKNGIVCVWLGELYYELRK